MPAEAPSPRQRRRRRAPEVAVAEIIAAAEELLSEVPFRDLSVDEVMARTTLSRSSFYVYFRDRYDLLLRVVSQIADELAAMEAQWLEGDGDPRETLRVALDGMALVYERHGAVLGAIADAAGSDPLVESVHNELIERFVRANADHVKEEYERCGVTDIDPLEVTRALVWMSERYLVRSLGTKPPRQSREVVARTLHTVCVRAIYGA